jgi:hypothetical protein
MRSRLRLGLGLALLAGGLFACTAGGGSVLTGASPYPPPEMDHRVASSHVELYWRCGREADRLRLDGLARNPWTVQEVRFLEFELTGVDATDRSISAARGELAVLLLGTNQIAPFRLELTPEGGEVRYDLAYQYRFADNEMDASAVWAGAGSRLLAQTQRYLVRDACADTAHRAK